MDNKKERYEWRLKRMSKDLTVTEVATAIGISQGSLSRWELDKRDMSADLVAKYKQFIEEAEIDFGE